MAQALTTRIKVKDADGRVIEEKEVATYAGLLSRAHDEGLKNVITELVQVPTKDNHGVAICKAQVTTSKGVFTGIGDASPENVNRKIAPHIIRMAETRAKARALRDAVNIGMVCLEELGGDEGDSSFAPDDRREREPQGGNVRDFPPQRERQGGPRNGGQDQRGQGGGHGGRRGEQRSEPMSDAQRRLLYRIMADAGFEGEAATHEILQRANVAELGQISKRFASQLIDSWKDQGRAA